VEGAWPPSSYGGAAPAYWAVVPGVTSRPLRMSRTVILLLRSILVLTWMSCSVTSSPSSLASCKTTGVYCRLLHNGDQWIQLLCMTRDMIVIATGCCWRRGANVFQTMQFVKKTHFDVNNCSSKKGGRTTGGLMTSRTTGLMTSRTTGLMTSCTRRNVYKKQK